ncbi:MAG: hypothetical protein KJS92_06810, partial [Bacteroidetes bacterium]|nr:hypothetical protein [Bacteroidota bacterium]
MKAKLRKLLLAMLLGVLLFAGLAVVLLRSRPVQKFVAGKVAAYLSDEWKVRVEIGGLETDFFHALTLERVLIGDRSNDTLFSFLRIHGRIKSVNTKTHRLGLSLFECSNGLVNLGIHKNDSGQNINFLVDYFTPKKKRTGPKVIWEMRAQKALLRNMEYRNFDDHESAPVPGSFDPYHITFSHINAQLDTFLLYDDSLHFGVRSLRASERSGMEIRNLKSQCRISYYAMDFLGFQLESGQSVLGDTLRFRYQGYKAFSDFSEAVTLQGRLHQSRLNINDLGIFQSALKGRKDHIILSGLFKGRLSSLRCKKLDIRYGSRGSIQGAISFNGLPDWKNTFVDASIQKWQTDAHDLGVLLGGIRIPPNLNALGVFRFNGSFTGFYNQFTASGAMNGDNGNLLLDGFSMNFREGYNQARYEGSLRVDRFNLGAFYSMEPLLGKVDADIKLQGSGLNKANFSIKLEGLIPTFELNKSLLHNAKIDGTLTPSSFSGEAALNDPVLGFRLNGDIHFSGSEPEYRISSLVLDHADLKALGFDSVPSKLECSGSSDISYSQAADLRGTVALNSIRWNRRGTEYYVPYAQFTATQSDEKREWTLRSHIGDAGLRGNFNSGNLAPALTGLMRELLPDYFPANQNQDTSVQFSYYLNLRNGKLPSSLLGEGISLGPMMLQGSFAAAGNVFELSSEQPFWLSVNGNSLRNLNIQCIKKYNQPITCVVGAERFIHDGQTWFKQMNVNMNLQQNKMPLRLSLLDSTGKNSIALSLAMSLNKDSIPISFSLGKVNWFGNQWVLDTSGHINIQKGKVQIRNFFLGSEQNYLELNGVAGSSVEDELRVQFGNFNLSDISPFLGRVTDSFAASINGSLTMRGAMSSDPYAECDILATDILYNGLNYGDFRLEASSLDVGKQIWLDGEATDGMLEGATIRGTIARSGVDEAP